MQSFRTIATIRYAKANVNAEAAADTMHKLNNAKIYGQCYSHTEIETRMECMGSHFSPLDGQ